MPISRYQPTSALARPGVCTSTTRPASPYEGMVIYETDTDRTLVWNASAWVAPNSTTANPPGMELIATGTASSGSELIVDSCFTSSYTNYQIVISNVCTAAGDGFTFQLRSAGSTLGTSGYYGTRTGTFIVGSATTVSTVNNAASMILPMVARGTTSTPSGCTWNVLMPQTASKVTGFFGQGWDSRVGEIGFLASSGFYNATTQANGFRVAAQGSTFTSITAKVYGFRD